MKKRVTRLVASTLTTGLVLSGMPIYANAEQAKPVSGEDGYELVWSDEFNGDSLNTSDWNVEAHEPGWVNAELQRYVSESDMDDNIQVGNGILSIKPTVDKKESGGSTVSDVFAGNGFDSTWSTTIASADWGPDFSADAAVSFANNKANVSVVNPGTEGWHVQIQKAGLTLVEGNEYTFSFKAKSDKARKIQFAVTNTSTYVPYKDATVTVGSEETEYSITFTMGADAPEQVAAQINLGRIDATEEGSAAANVEFSDVKLIDQTAGSTPADGGSTFNYKDYSYTSGRVNTQGKKDFKYGYFEAKARVPEGMGYLPAFWMMASDEGNYGQWPQCGEIDIMEVMGQETDKSYHTIHYGYDSGAGHRQNQGTYKTADSEDDFYEGYHVYGLEWEPDHLTWYVDGTEVYTTSDWFTGKDEDGQLTYPAPFDQEFYIILNLAVGGSWVGYPDEAAVNDMANQSFDIDYVRVYQKDPEVYKEMEKTAERPEKEISYREADTNGNYVINGNFANVIKEAESADENWELHLEADAGATTYVVENNSITIDPSAAGGQKHSIQLKQEGIPMYKGWTYELTFDAYAEEARNIVVDVEGPDRGWTRYFNDTTVKIGTDKKTYTYEFTMSDKTDSNGSLEFNLGAQGSTADVTISNVKLTHKSGEKEPDTVEKVVRPDGNYVYNGSFDQGEKRLGYWEIDEEDKNAVSVTNDNGVRELSVKVEVPKGTSATNPVVVSQSELAPLAAGNYSFSFDAYTTDGAADGIKASVAGKSFVPSLGAEKKSFEYAVEFAEKIDRTDADVVFEFTKPGTYFLDNVVVRENSTIKNGSFDSGIAGFDCQSFSPGSATFGVDSIQEGNNTALDATITSVGNADWNVQVKQHGIPLENGKTYKLTFDARASIDRTISVCMQANGVGDNWSVYSGEDKEYQLTSEWQSFENVFTMEAETDMSVDFSVALGKFADIDEGVAHHVYLDNVNLVEVGSEEEKVEDPKEEEPKVEDQDDKKEEQKQEEQKTDDKKEEQKQEDKKSDDKKDDSKKTDDKKEETKPSNEWVDGKWYGEDGKQDYAATAEWKSDASGWWFEDSSGWYPKNEWQKIDGKWYFFTESGYMDYGEYRDGCWLGDDGAWVEEYSGGHWMTDGTGWWFEDNGWYPANQYLWIDGVKYWFNVSGYTK